MSGAGNKEVMSRNLKLLMERNGKDRKQVCEDLGFAYTTFTDWVKGNKYPRIDSIEKLANYFGVLKSDLIEDKGGVFSVDESAPADRGHYKDILADEGVRILFDADCGLSDDQMQEIVDFIRFKRRNEEH